MKPYFNVVKIRDGVYHIGDKMMVYATLIVGEKSALLLDTTNGIGNMRAAVEELTALPYRVIDSHGHGDHTRGNYQFDEVYINKKDIPLCRDWTDRDGRERTIKGALAAGIVPEDFDTQAYVEGGTGNLKELDIDEVIDLGGITVEIIPMPGHTPGSIGLLLREKRLLLTSDACNPMMWMFLKGASSIPAWARMLRRVREVDFDYFLPGHIAIPLPKARFDVYIQTADSINMKDAVPMKHQPPTEGRPQAYVYSLGPITGEETLADIDFTAIYFVAEQLVDKGD